MGEENLTAREQNLTRRYLIWCYKTTKEELDRVDRYFTQLEVDRFMLEQLKGGEEYSSGSSQEYQGLVDQFQAYMAKKEENVLKKKFQGQEQQDLDPKYLYLRNRFQTIEDAICSFFGKSELVRIQDLYEEEMTQRILKTREHT
mgnify:CR=1 FL=1